VLFNAIEEMGMKLKLALAAAAVMGAFAMTAPTIAAPLAGAGVATQNAKIDGKAAEQVRYYRRHYRHRGWRPYRYGYRRHYRPYYGYGAYSGYGYGYPYYRRRPGIYLGFGF
jgi:hypothetical protein